MGKKRSDDVLEAPGFRMEGQGRFTRIDIKRTEEQQREFLEHMAAVHKDLPNQIREKVLQLEELVAQLDPLDVLANACIANTPISADTYKEYEFEGGQCYIEYITLLCLKRARWTSDHRFIGAAEHEPIDKLTKEIFRDTELYYATEAPAPNREAPRSTLEEMRFLTRWNELVVRFPGYHHHLSEVLVALFGQVEQWMKQNLGFTIQDALASVDGIKQLVSQRFKERWATARHELKLLRREIREHRRGRLKKARYDPDLVKKFAAMKEKKMLRETKNMTTAWVFFAIGDTLSFTADDLADLTQIPVERTSAFLQMFSLRFGEVPKDFCMPTPTHPFRTRPLVKDGDKYLCPSTAGLLWGLRPGLEAALNPANPSSVNTRQLLWERYTKKRGDFLEAEALRLLDVALKHAEIHANLKYRPEDDQPKEAELDGMVIFDRILLLVEAKAGVMKPSARRGAFASMVQAVKDLIVDAHAQALRARSYIEAAADPVFHTEDGTAVHVDKSSIDQILLITVTLDDVSVFSPILHEVATLGIFKSSELPWAVPLLDFRVICELVEFPSQLVHFLRRRRRLGELAFVRAHDELDYFGHYLTEGLFFEHLADTEISEVQLLTYTTQFDDYYFTEMGLRSKPAPRPKQKMPSGLRKIIKELEELRPENYVSVVCTFLDFDARTRRTFVRLLDRVTTAARNDGKLHDFSIIFDYYGSTRGLTVMCGTNIEAQRLHERLAHYCALKKYQQRSDSWIGLGRLANRPETFHMAVTVEGPWEKDEQLENAVRAFFPAAD